MYKVVLIANNIKDLEKLVNDGWAPLNAFTHPKGVLLIMKKL